MSARHWRAGLAALSLWGWCSCKQAAPPPSPPPVPAAAPPVHAAAPPHRPPPGVEVWPGLIESGSDDLDVGWTAPWLNGTIVLRDGHLPNRLERQLVNCAALNGVQESDVLLGSQQWERDVFKEKSIRCRALALVRRATAPRAGSLADVVASNNPGDLLPAGVLPHPGKATDTRSWRAVDPTLAFDRAAARAAYRELVVHGRYDGRLTWWASGDFNGDGLADAVLFLNVARTADLNAPNLMRAVVLTRRQPGGRVTILETIE